MNGKIESIDYNCKDCKFYDGYCKVYGVDVPDVCNDFTLNDENSFLGGDEDIV